MAFTNAPSTDTYSSHRLPLCQEPFNLYDNTYQLMWNAIPHKNGKESYTKSRYGVDSGTAVGAVNGAGVTCRGVYVWEKSVGTSYYYVVVGTSVYTATALTGPYTAVTTLLTNATTPVRFTEYINDSNVKSLILVDGVEGYIFTSNAAGTKITDVDFPSPHVPFPVFLDGYLFLAKANTGDIYNCDLNSPSSWTAGSFISSEVYPDDITALVKINNYILAIGASGCEYFYDAANATGSPLARYEGQVVPFGTTMPNTIAYTQNLCCFVGQDRTGQYHLKVIEDFKYKDVPAPFLTQAFANNVTSANAANLRGFLTKQYGKMQYGLSQDGTINNDTSGTCYFHYNLDFESGIWSQFGRGDSTSKSLYGPSAYKTYPVFFAAQGGIGSIGTIVAGVAQNVAFIGQLTPSSQGYDNLPINSLSSANYYYLTSVPLDYMDYGTMNRKFMSRVGVVYTSLAEYSSADNTLLPRISWNDSPSQSTSSLTNYVNQRVVMGGYYQNGNVYNTDFPFITQLGTFRRRSLNVECYGGVTFELLEVDINKGQQ